jgi:hypothetical protein
MLTLQGLAQPGEIHRPVGLELEDFATLRMFQREAVGVQGLAA